jgi:hypothetical protein
MQFAAIAAAGMAPPGLIQHVGFESETTLGSDLLRSLRKRKRGVRAADVPHLASEVCIQRAQRSPRAATTYHRMLAPRYDLGLRRPKFVALVDAADVRY